MALPTRADLMTLDYARLGAPFVRVEAKPLQTTSLDYARLGAPFVVGNAGVPIRYYFDMQTNHLLGS